MTEWVSPIKKSRGDSLCPWKTPLNPYSSQSLIFFMRRCYSKFSCCHSEILSRSMQHRISLWTLQIKSELALYAFLVIIHKPYLIWLSSICHSKNQVNFLIILRTISKAMQYRNYPNGNVIKLSNHSFTQQYYIYWIKSYK